MRGNLRLGDNHNVTMFVVCMKDLSVRSDGYYAKVINSCAISLVWVIQLVLQISNSDQYQK